MPTRLDKLVAERFGLSRRAAQEAVRNGRVDVAGARCDEPGREVGPGEPVEFFPNRPKARTVAGRLKVLHEDRHVIVVDKPAGVLTLPTPARERDTLVERVGRYLTIRHGRPRPYVGVMHRLDMDTSGALALARSPEALRAFQALFKAHDVERQYLAVVEGRVGPGTGTVDLPLVDAAATSAAASPERRARAAARSPTSASSSGSARSPRCWPAGSRPAGPTRSASIWPSRGTRSSARRSTAPADGPGARPGSTARPSTPRPSASSTRSPAARCGSRHPCPPTSTP
jgi:ribosomal 50S subunit-recycling heat shock protein